MGDQIFIKNNQFLSEEFDEVFKQDEIESYLPTDHIQQMPIPNFGNGMFSDRPANIGEIHMSQVNKTHLHQFSDDDEEEKQGNEQYRYLKQMTVHCQTVNNDEQMNDQQNHHIDNQEQEQYHQEDLKYQVLQSGAGGILNLQDQNFPKQSEASGSAETVVGGATSTQFQSLGQSGLVFQGQKKEVQKVDQLQQQQQIQGQAQVLLPSNQQNQSKIIQGAKLGFKAINKEKNSLLSSSGLLNSNNICQQNSNLNDLNLSTNSLISNKTIDQLQSGMTSQNNSQFIKSTQKVQQQQSMMKGFQNSFHQEMNKNEQIHQSQQRLPQDSDHLSSQWPNYFQSKATQGFSVPQQIQSNLSEQQESMRQIPETQMMSKVKSEDCSSTNDQLLQQSQSSQQQQQQQQQLLQYSQQSQQIFQNNSSSSFKLKGSSTQSQEVKKPIILTHQNQSQQIQQQQTQNSLLHNQHLSHTQTQSQSQQQQAQNMINTQQQQQLQNQYNGFMQLNYPSPNCQQQYSYYPVQQSNPQTAFIQQHYSNPQGYQSYIDQSQQASVLQAGYNPYEQSNQVNNSQKLAYSFGTSYNQPQNHSNLQFLQHQSQLPFKYPLALQQRATEISVFPQVLNSASTNISSFKIKEETRASEDKNSPSSNPNNSDLLPSFNNGSKVQKNNTIINHLNNSTNNNSSQANINSGNLNNSGVYSSLTNTSLLSNNKLTPNQSQFSLQYNPMVLQNQGINDQIKIPSFLQTYSPQTLNQTTSFIPSQSVNLLSSSQNNNFMKSNQQTQQTIQGRLNQCQIPNSIEDQDKVVINNSNYTPQIVVSAYNNNNNQNINSIGTPINNSAAKPVNNNDSNDVDEEDDDDQGNDNSNDNNGANNNNGQKPRKPKNETKNIPKNYAKAFLRYIIDKERVDEMKKILKQIDQSLEYEDIKKEAKHFKKNMNAIKDVRKIWQDDTNEHTKSISKFMRIASHQFLKKEAISYIFSSNKIKNSKSHIIYRHVMSLAMADPEKFNNIKSLYKNAYQE